MTLDKPDASLSSIFEGAAPVYTISDEAFNKLKALCETPEGITQFLDNDPDQVMNTILALSSRKKKGYKALALKILREDAAVWGLAEKDQAARIMTLLEGDTFTAEQITQILSANWVVWGLALTGQAERVMDLLEGTTLTPAQKAQILSANGAVEELAEKDQAARVMDLLEGDTFTPDQITQILSAKGAVEGLARNGQAERVQALQQRLQQEQAGHNAPSSPVPPGLEP